MTLFIEIFCVFFIMEIDVVEWSAPVVKNRPSPCGVITFTRISDHHATVFAGNYQIARSDDLYIFDLKHKVCMFMCVCVRMRACVCV